MGWIPPILFLFSFFFFLVSYYRKRFKDLRPDLNLFLFLRPLVRKVGIQGQSSTLVCLLAVSTGYTEGSQTQLIKAGNRNRGREDNCSHVYAHRKKGDDVLQGTCNKLVSFHSTGEFICIQQCFHYSCASLRDCMVMKPEHRGPELRCLPEKGRRLGGRDQHARCRSSSCCCCSQLTHNVEPTGVCVFWN